MAPINSNGTWRGLECVTPTHKKVWFPTSSLSRPLVKGSFCEMTASAEMTSWCSAGIWTHVPGPVSTSYPCRCGHSRSRSSHPRTRSPPSHPAHPSLWRQTHRRSFWQNSLLPARSPQEGEEGGGETSSMNELTKTLFTLSWNFDRHVIIIQECLRLCIINSKLIMSNILTKHWLLFFDFHLIYLLLHD